MWTQFKLYRIDMRALVGQPETCDVIVLYVLFNLIR